MNAKKRREQQQAPVLSRRTLLIGGGAGALMVALSSLAYLGSKGEKDTQAADTAADQFAEGIPETLPGAATIERYITRGSQHCLVHIRQIHSTKVNAEGVFAVLKERLKLEPGSEEERVFDETAKQQIARMRAVQDPSVDRVHEDIKRILQAFIMEHGIREVFQEGVHPANEMAYKGLRTSIDDSLSTAAKAAISAERETDPKRIAAWRALEEKIVTETRALIENTIRPDLRSSTDFYLDGTIDIRAAEMRETRTSIDALREENMTPEKARAFENALTDDREDNLLSIVHEDGAPAAVTIFGGKHDWRNNVEKWNREHPEAPFSLIVITPASYNEERGQSRKRLLDED